MLATISNFTDKKKLLDEKIMQNCAVKLNVFIDALTNGMEDRNECKGL